MSLDIDAWTERAAIMEFDGGLSRFQAETLAAKAQGYQRYEFINAIRDRNSQQARDHGSAPARDATNDLPGMQPPSAQKGRSVPERQISA